MFLRKAKNKRLLLMVAGGVLALLCVSVTGILLLRQFYPYSSIAYALARIFGPMPGQMKDSHTMGVMADLEVHSGATIREEQTTYFIFQDGEASIEVAATLQIISESEHTETYALAGLLDYVQVPLTVTQTAYPVYLVEAEPYKPVYVDFRFSMPNQPGRHQLWLVLFQEIDMSGGLESYLKDFQAALAFDIVIGEDVVPEIVYEEAPVVFEFDPKLDVGGIQINQDPRDGRQPWISATVTSGAVVDYYIHVGNDAEDVFLPAHPYVLVAWLDWQQVPLGAGDTPAFFGYIEDGQRHVIPAQVEIPADRMGHAGAIHELQLLYIAYPYAHMTPRTEGAPRPHYYFSQRTALIPAE